MMDINTVQAFLGWNLLLHLGIMVVWFLFFFFARRWVILIHSRIFAMNSDQMLLQYFKILAAYKILVLTFVAIPYVVIRFLL